jgi:predicted adenylyl cyclase CyaB
MPWYITAAWCAEEQKNMATNIEIKAAVRDFQALRHRAEALSDTPCQMIEQEDTFFHTPRGRLKLRRLRADYGQLVYYLREDGHGPKHSEYSIVETGQPEQLRALLAAAYGVRGVVSKMRFLYLVGQTRIHLDQVEGLGQFMELEVVMQPGQSNAHGEQIAQELMERLGISPSDLIDVAYIDLLQKETS